MIDFTIETSTNSANRLINFCLTRAIHCQLKPQLSSSSSTIFWNRYQTELGMAYVCCFYKLLAGIGYHHNLSGFTDFLKQNWPSLNPTQNPTWVDHALNEALVKIKGAKTLPVAINGTEFQLKVWQHLIKVRPTEVCSYQSIAQKIAHKNHTRAVASAIARNQLAVLIPCHRIVKADGQLGGFRWGLKLKQDLLNFEVTHRRFVTKTVS